MRADVEIDYENIDHLVFIAEKNDLYIKEDEDHEGYYYIIDQFNVLQSGEESMNLSELGTYIEVLYNLDY